MNTYTSPEVIEIGAADEMILGVKSGPAWDSSVEQFMMENFSVLDVDEERHSARS